MVFAPQYALVCYNTDSIFLSIKEATVAFASTGYWNVAITLEDNNANKAPVSYSVDDTQTEADVTTQAQSVAAALTSLSDAYVSQISITRTYGNTDGNAAPATSEIERKLTLRFVDAFNNVVSTRDVPSPVASIEVAGTDTIDPANALVAAYVSALAAASANTGRGEPLATVKKAWIKHRSRKLRA